VLDHQTSEGRRTLTAAQQRAKGRHTVGQEYVVADAEQQLVEQVGQSIHDRSRGDQQRAPILEPGRQVPVSAGPGIPKAVRLVHDHQRRPSWRQPAATHLFVREK